MRAIASVVVVVLVVLAICVLVFLIGMRRRSPAVQRLVRRVNRAFFNPRQMRTAGTPGAFAGVIRHVGRVSGTAYQTPVGPFPTDDGFVIALPYGSDPDWLKNVLAAGSATLLFEGGAYEVDRPELIPTAEAAPFLPPKEERRLRMFGVDQCLRVRTVAHASATD